MSGIRGQTRTISQHGFGFTFLEWSYWLQNLCWASTPVSPAVLAPKCGMNRSCFQEQRQQQNCKAFSSSLGRCQQFDLFAKEGDHPCCMKSCSHFETAWGRSSRSDENGLWIEWPGMQNREKPWKADDKPWWAAFTALETREYPHGSKGCHE